MLRLCLLLLALWFPSLVAWLYFVVFAVGDAANPVQQGIYAAGKVVQFGIPLLDWWLWDRRRPARELLSPRGLGMGLGFGLLVAGGGLLLYFLVLRGSPFLAGTAEQVRQKVAQLGIASPVAFFALALFMALIHSFLEEYYWRWYAYGQLRERIPVVWANLLAALAFASHHLLVLAVFSPGKFWTKAVPVAATVALGGMIWAWLYQRSGSLLSSWVSHALIDAAIFTIGWDLIAAP